MGVGRMAPEVVVAALVMVLGGCASSAALSTDKMQKRAREAGAGGFVSESDEPSSRGVLQKVSPDEFDVVGRFCLSPDGEYIVFAGTQGRRTSSTSSIVHLWRVPSNGGSPVKITSGGTTACEFPSYTPDGKFIVYSAGGNIWRVDQNGAGGRTKLQGSGSNTDFSPHVSCDGKVVFCSIQQVSGGRSLSSEPFIWILGADGVSITQLRPGLFPSWSPDGNSIVFEYKGDIWTVTADGTNLTQLTNTPRIYEGVPSFGSEGGLIYFASNEGKDGEPMLEDFNIWCMAVSGSEKTQLTELDSWDSWPVADERGVSFLSARAATSPLTRLQRVWRLNTR